MAGLEAITNGTVIAGSAALLAVIVVSWLATYRAPQAAPVGSGRWFTLPVSMQIGAGLGVIALCVYVGYLLWIPLPLSLSPTLAAILRIFGSVVFLAGLFLALWARWALGAMYGVSTSSATQLRVKHRLIQNGPYAFVRHPMYLGYWLVFAGALLMYHTWTPLLLLAICVPSFYRRARREEQALAAAFGEEWQAYVARTKFIVLFAWRGFIKASSQHPCHRGPQAHNIISTRRTNIRTKQGLNEK